MNKLDIEQKLKKIMSEVFEIEINKIGTEASSLNLEQWDSLNHMNLIVAIEQEFDIEIDEDMILELMSVKSLSNYLLSV